VVPRSPANRPNLVSVGTIIWLSSELMFFAALFAMYFTVRSVYKGEGVHWPGAHLDVRLGSINTTVLLLSSVTCQMGVFAVERGQVGRLGSIFNVAKWGLREWYVLTFLMGLYFDLGQAYEYHDLVSKEHLTISSSAYGSVFYIPTGFHGLHVAGGLVAFLFLLGAFGALTAAHRRQRRVLLIAGGVGITPLRALFQTIPAGAGDLTLIYRASQDGDLAFQRELEQLARQRQARLWFVVGRRADLGEDPLNAVSLAANVPGLARHDVYICGPPGMTHTLLRELRAAGVPRRNIHHETFEF